MLNKKDLDYFEYGKVEINKFWKRLGGKPGLEDRSILDFGCGHGALCVDLAKSGAKLINGIDVNSELIDFAKENLNLNFESLKAKIFFEKKDLLESNFNQKFNLIVTKDTFEHAVNLPEILDKFYELLENGGKVYAGFGPLYNAYNGDHGRTQLNFPWLHTILPESLIIKRYNKKNKDQIQKIEDLGLSKYSFKEYLKIFKNSKFQIEYFQTNQSDHPVSKIFNLLSKFKILEEYFTYNIYCVLKK